MQSVQGVHSIKTSFGGAIVTIGNFDGVHVGHRKIISQVVREAKATGVPSVIFSFNPHPRQVLFPDKTFKRLFPLEDLEETLDVLGVNYLVLEPFSKELSQLSPESFIKDYIYKPFSPQKLVVGYDFSFGANRAGTLERLAEITRDLKINLEVIAPQKIGDVIVSSSRIREAVVSGNVRFAQELLGRCFYIEGSVVQGEGRGRKIGFPTANIQTAFETLPPYGVYCGWAWLQNKKYKAVVNIGVNPTFQASESQKTKIEVHVLGLSRDLYNESLRFEFVERIRDEQKFDGVESLKTQIKKDIDVALSVLRE